MDSLETIPPVETTQSDGEQAVMKRLFGGAGARPGSAAPGRTIGEALKLALYLTVVFLVVANPWSGELLHRLPGCDENPALRFAVRTAVFFFVVMLLVKWAA